MPYGYIVMFGIKKGLAMKMAIKILLIILSIGNSGAMKQPTIESPQYYDFHLESAIKENNTDEIKKILAAQPELAQNLLYFAISHGNIDIVKLIATLADIKKANKENSLLHAAILSKSADIITYLLDQGLDIERKVGEYTPLDRAIDNYRFTATRPDPKKTNVTEDLEKILKIIDVLCGRGANIKQVNLYWLHPENYYRENLRPLVNKLIECLDARQETPEIMGNKLILAIYNSNKDLVTTIVKNRPDLAKNKLEFAARIGDKDVFEVLVDNGANVIEENKKQQIPLLSQALTNNSIPLIEYLINQGLNINDGEETVLHTAVRSYMIANTKKKTELLETIKFLCRHGAILKNIRLFNDGRLVVIPLLEVAKDMKDQQLIDALSLCQSPEEKKLHESKHILDVAQLEQLAHNFVALAMVV